MDRIRAQAGVLLKLRGGTLRVTAEMVPIPPAADPRTLEQQILAVADQVTEIIRHGLESKPQEFTEKENHKYAN